MTTPTSSSVRSLSPHHKRSFSTRHISPRPSLHQHAHLPHHRMMTQLQTGGGGAAAVIPPPTSSSNRRQSQHQQQRRGSTTGSNLGVIGGGNGGAASASGGSSSGATISPRHQQHKASYFFPELTQGCLFFRDFIPGMIEKGGTFSSPQYEPFSKLVERANQWMATSCDIAIQIIKAECVQIRAEHNTDSVTSTVSFHSDYVDWGMHLIGLRLWCRQAAATTTAPTASAAAPPSTSGVESTTDDKPTSSTSSVSPLVSSRCLSLEVDNYQPISKQIYLSPDASSPRLSPMTATTGDESGVGTTVTDAASGARRSPRPASSNSSRTSDPTTPPVFTGRLAYLDVLPDLVHAGVRTIEYERLSSLVAKLNQKILDKKACNILTVQTVTMRLHSNETPDTECTCFSLHGHKQKCRLLFLRVFYFVPKPFSGTPPSRSSPRDATSGDNKKFGAHSTGNIIDNISEHHSQRSPTEPLSHASSAASSRRSSLSRDAHQHQKLLSQLAESQHHHRHQTGSSPNSRRGSGAYKEEIGLADFVPQIVRTNAYGKQGIEGMTSLARRAGEWFKRYREEHPDIRLVNFQTVTYYVRDWKHVDTERTFIMVHGDSDTFQYEHRALRIFYSRYVECVPYLPPFPLIDLKAFAPRQLNTPAELADTRFDSATQTASQIDQWLCDSECSKKLLDIETYDVTYCGMQDTAKAIEVPYLYAESRDKFVLTCFFLYFTDDETSAARKEPMELSPWHANGSSSGAMGGSRRHSIATINLRNKVAREDENPDGCSLM